MTDGHDQIRPLARAQILDEIAQALDSRGVHPAEMGRRLAPARADIGDADERHLDALALQDHRRPEHPFAAGLVVEVVADHRTVEAGHGLLEPLRAVGGFPVAGNEGVAAESVEGIENDFALGPGRRARALELVAAIEQETGAVAVRPLMLDRGLEASITAHHLDLGARSRHIFRMGFELRMGIGEIEQRDALAVPIRCGRLARDRAGDGAKPDGPQAGATQQRHHRSRRHEESPGRKRSS